MFLTEACVNPLANHSVAVSAFGEPERPSSSHVLAPDGVQDGFAEDGDSSAVRFPGCHGELRLTPEEFQLFHSLLSGAHQSGMDEAGFVGNHVDQRVGEQCQHALTGLTPLVETVKKFTPEWKHVVSDIIYAKQKAQQVIISYAFTAQLEAATGDLFNALKDLSTNVAAWSVSCLLDKVDDWLVLKAAATAAHNEGKLFLRVRAGCNIVQNKRGKIQVDEASSLLAKGPLPDKLASALRYCITVHGGGQKDGGTVKFKRPACDDANQPPQCIQDIVAAPPKRQKFGFNVAANAASVSEHPGASSSMSFFPKANSCKSGTKRRLIIF